MARDDADQPLPAGGIFRRPRDRVPGRWLLELRAREGDHRGYAVLVAQLELALKIVAHESLHNLEPEAAAGAQVEAWRERLPVVVNLDEHAVRGVAQCYLDGSFAAIREAVLE